MTGERFWMEPWARTTLAIISICFGVDGPCAWAAANSVSRPAAKLMSVPLSFERNQGQAGATVQFVARGSGYALYFGSGKVVLSLQRRQGTAAVDTVRMGLIGGNANVEAVELDRQPGVVSYFIGNDPRKWRTGIPTYGKVSYVQVYRGIDLVFYGNQSRLEYDFVVAAGADPAPIAWRIEGARPGIDGNGNLTLHAAHGPVTFEKPIVYQMDGTRKIAVEGSFVLAKDLVSFRIGRYDHTRELVIDPVLSYATYLAGTALDTIGNGLGPGAHDNVSQGLAVDSAGSIYVTGYTSSLDFPITNAFDKTYPSSNTNSPSTFVTKFSPDGSSLVYSTFLGGSSGDQAYGIAVDSAGEAYITGLARSPDFPITNGAYQTICSPIPTDTPSLLQPGCPGGGSSAFVTKLNSTGTGLVYSTFLGGYGPGWATAIAVDSAGRAYIVGDETVACQNRYAFHSCFPTTGGALIGGSEPSADAAQFAFVAVFDPAGANLLYSTLYGDLNVACPAGCGLTQAGGVAVDSTGAFYAIGYTKAARLPTTSGVIQPTGAPLDPTGVYVTAYRGFIAKFNPVTSPSGVSLAYGTYLGGKTGNLSDYLSGIAIDSSDNIYVAGFTNSGDFPVTSGAYQTACGQNGACGADHITKINPTGTAILWSTYLGNARADGGDSMQSCGPVQLDGKGNVYLIGSAADEFPQINPLESMAHISTGLVVAELDPSGSTLLFSSPIGSGGLDPEFPGGLAVDAAGNIYLAGNDLGNNLITTAGAFQTAIPTDHCCYHGFVAKIAGGPAVKLATAGQIEPFAPEAIVAGYGAGLASVTATATTIPLPTSIEGNSVTVTDSAGAARQAPLFYVSSAQVNFEIPAGTALGAATAAFQNHDGTVQPAAIQIGSVSPGIFALDTAGLVAAWVLPVVSNVQQPLQPVYQVTGGSLAPLPIDVAAPNSQFYLEMYGTGLRNAKSVTASVNNANVPVLYFGPAPGWAGEDQVNIGPLPVALAGQGSVNIVVTADGHPANTVTVTIQ